MTGQTLIEVLNGKRVRLTVDGGILRAVAPPGVLTDDLKTALKEHKQEIIQALYLSGLTKIERQAYDEWFATMVGEPFGMTPEEAHRKTRELLEASRKFLEANPHLKADPCRQSKREEGDSCPGSARYAAIRNGGR
ncbi:MAG: hypothetical protein HZA02_08515 [Nitrospinae bacterium]|nr:hypothetical protein [Nitrospinota bacterium]